MWYWIVAAAVFVAAFTAWVVMVFTQDDINDEFWPWPVGIFLCGLYSAAWALTLPVSVLIAICVGGGYLIYKKWFKKEKK